MFNTLFTGPIHVIAMPPLADGALGKSLLAEVIAWCALPVETLVLVFTDITLIEPQFYPALLVFSWAVRARGKKLITCGLSATLAADLARVGLIDAFGVIDQGSFNGRPRE